MRALAQPVGRIGIYSSVHSWASNVAGFFRCAQWSVVPLWPVVHCKVSCYRLRQSKHSDQTCPSMTLEDADSPQTRVDGLGIFYSTPDV
jgi:hypothetical protein